MSIGGLKQFKNPSRCLRYPEDTDDARRTIRLFGVPQRPAW